MKAPIYTRVSTAIAMKHSKRRRNECTRERTGTCSCQRPYKRLKHETTKNKHDTAVVYIVLQRMSQGRRGGVPAKGTGDALVSIHMMVMQQPNIVYQLCSMCDSIKMRRCALIAAQLHGEISWCERRCLWLTTAAHTCNYTNAVPAASTTPRWGWEISVPYTSKQQ